MPFRPLIVASSALAFTVQPAFAHHCFVAEFDAKAPVVISGKISKIDWVNPHTLIQISGANGAGPAKDWLFWAATPNALQRSGITKTTLAEGVEVTIRGYEAKDKSCPVNTTTQKAACVADGRTITLANGVQMLVASTGDGGPDGKGLCNWGGAPKTPSN
jgi:hypothetical protein